MPGLNARLAAVSSFLPKQFAHGTEGVTEIKKCLTVYERYENVNVTSVVFTLSFLFTVI